MTFAVTFAAASVLPLTTPDVHAQLIDDTLFVWRGYSRTSETRLSIYESTDLKRPHVAVLTEVESNQGMSVTEDGRYVVEQIGREYGIDPSKVVWFFRWGAFSFPGAAPVGKQLILRATFNRSKNGNLGLPLWRVAAPADVEELTDRRLRLTR